MIAFSLTDLLGESYIDCLCRAADFLHGMPYAEARTLADERVEAYPQAMQDALDALLPKVGTRVIAPLAETTPGAPTDAYARAANDAASPVTGRGFFRLGQDGRLYLAAKCEHYHIPLGHNFPAYRLLDIARRLGVTNAAHNNTRGHITRLCEQALVRAAGSGALSRVINLETGSLVCEAAIKIMLTRFYPSGNGEAPLAGKIPVFLVMGDYEGGTGANYHGTCFLAQALRGMWRGYTQKAGEAGLFEIRPVKINDAEDFAKQFEAANWGERRVAGFLHEIILMNYGSIRLTRDFLQSAYAMCKARGVPILCDEIQSCVWFEDFFLFRQYGLEPDFVTVGKGFPGGNYPASRLLITREMDRLAQFDALVTNGQEELGSLSYLITMEYAKRDAARIAAVSARHEAGMEKLAAKHADTLSGVEGKEFLSSLVFRDVERTLAFAKRFQARCIDVSVQAYKQNCPPAAMFKLPLISTPAMVDFLHAEMDAALEAIR